MDAAYTKLVGAVLLFGCISSFLSLAFGALDVGGKEFRAGGYIGDRLAAFLAEYLNRTGSIILILTLLFAAIILSTQFSFGRLFSALSQIGQERWTALRAALEQRRDEKQREKQRQEVLKKHLGKDAKDAKESKERPKDPVPAPVVAAGKAARGQGVGRADAGAGHQGVQDRGHGLRRRRRVEGRVVASRRRRRSSGGAGDGVEGADAAAAGARQVAGRAEEGGLHAAAATRCSTPPSPSRRSTSAS